MEQVLHGRRVQIEAAGDDLDRDAVVAADEGEGFAAVGAVAVEGEGHESNVFFLVRNLTVNACEQNPHAFAEVA